MTPTLCLGLLAPSAVVARSGTPFGARAIRSDRRIGGAARSDTGRCDCWHGSDLAGIID